MNRIALAFGLTILPAGASVALAVCAQPGVARADEVAPASSDSTAVRNRTVPVVAGGWTAAKAAERAEATSWDVTAKKEAVRAASAAVDQTVVGFFPRLSGIARYQRLSPTPDPSNPPLIVTSPASMRAGPIAAGTPLIGIPFSLPTVLDQWTFQATLTVPISDYVLRLSHANAQASHSLDAARYDRMASVAAARTNARLAFYQWASALLQKAVLDDAVLAAQDHLRDAEHLFAADRASRADVLAAAAIVAADELSVHQSVEQLNDAEEQLRTLTHIPASESPALGEDLTSALAPAPLDLAALKSEALSHRPDLLSLGANEEAQSEAVSVARASAWPVLGASADLVGANPNLRLIPQEAVFHATWDIGLQLTWSPNDTFNARTVVDQAGANLAKFKAQVALARDAVTLEVAQAVNASRTADAAVATAATRLESAEEAYRVRRSLFRAGRATSVELTDAESSLFSARITALSARINQRVAKVRIDHAVGRDAKR
jgi:outer membrane protein